MQTRASHHVRQQQIVDAARKIITRDGIEHLTLGALADELELSEAAIYRHVTGKQEILLLVLDDIESTLLEAITEAQAEEPTPKDRLASVMQAHLSYSERRRGVAFLVLNEALRLDDKALRKRAAAVVSRYLDAVRTVLVEGQTAGQVRPDVDTEAAAKLFLGTVQSAVTVWALNARKSPLSEGYAPLWALYWRAVGAH